MQAALRAAVILSGAIPFPISAPAAPNGTGNGAAPAAAAGDVEATFLALLGAFALQTAAQAPVEGQTAAPAGNTPAALQDGSSEATAQEQNKRDKSDKADKADIVNLNLQPVAPAIVAAAPTPAPLPVAFQLGIGQDQADTGDEIVEAGTAEKSTVRTDAATLYAPLYTPVETADTKFSLAAFAPAALNGDAQTGQASARETPSSVAAAPAVPAEPKVTAAATELPRAPLAFAVRLQQGPEASPAGKAATPADVVSSAAPADRAIPIAAGAPLEAVQPAPTAKLENLSAPVETGTAEETQRPIAKAMPEATGAREPRQASIPAAPATPAAPAAPAMPPDPATPAVPSTPTAVQPRAVVEAPTRVAARPQDSIQVKPEVPVEAPAKLVEGATPETAVVVDATVEPAPETSPRALPRTAARINEQAARDSSPQAERSEQQPAPRNTAERVERPAANSGSDEKSNDAEPAARTAAPARRAASTTAQVHTAETGPALQMQSEPRSRETAAAAPAAPVETENASQVKATGAAKEISVQVGDSPRENVQVRVVEKAGEVHVAVTANDERVAQSLRGDLDRLSQAFGKQGYQAETWQPATAAAGDARQQAEYRQQQQGGSQEAWKDASEGNRGRQQDARQQQNRRDTPQWVAELEESSRTDFRSNLPWLSQA